MSVDQATVRRVAHLARIAVSEEELEPLKGELNAILAFVEQLANLDVADVEPMTGVIPMELPMREDVVTDGHYPEKILANAPEAEGGFFTVPKVVE
ncbi:MULTISPECIES: Asp-tRNA(Asn)/Glu-tRNA(Gln) amidotransferase subunit GatC [Azorhizobium]|uniref:Aspartyl/glutamyl-tRNA(Asn/Gln) amidotransferase subunit C n=1 Tax=Azorhizobium caulinodans (strain ATCC 43989 / DSM 5975 / JCM 20966 / LMG 6465 / NBRC 14845 / NCIMB 13405 / ORS 571) TaxID=438753 RepID=GATC_AZOC5|nr:MULTISPECIES: Asp-tRNA(Asn)/Glu-tRNA(Gln) amidotransferase subunit GatC [Azorhizobium]A8I9X4.1 RecName: Full=Aspartyl/glutamyl-tRNA(Asn/Gln) amidotransferase subunit C; Short=Asp/Glu-ADT subunit C [Azorhizobium caulinodans ORS 571]TDT90341.1 aspartyl/glutamyl-tRNA(Asn/Gln) amidotransferase subunit C [Azorhizobium sp. AG788]BAF88841.1 glutamyl-tRNA(Gln) amidotransferase C subunit [Azorhizobium caulinodans ORS 571]